MRFQKNFQFYKFSLYGFLKNLRFFDPFLILFFREKGLTFLEIGSLYAIREILTNFLEIPTGIIADSIGRRSIMILSFTSYIISFFLFYIFNSYLPFIFAMLFFSLGEACRTGTHKAMIFEYLRINHWEDQKVYYYGNTRGWSQMGSALSSIIAGVIVFYSGNLNTIFLFSTIPYILDLILMTTYPKELDGNIKKITWQNFKANIVLTTKDFLHSFKNPILLKSMINTSIFSGYYKAIKDYLQPILKTLALSLPLFVNFGQNKRTAIVIGFVYFFIFFASSWASRFSGKFSNQFRSLSSPLNLTLILGLLFGILSGMFYVLGLTTISIVFYLSIFLIENLRKPMGVAYIGDKLKKNILATSLSATSQLQTITTALVALLLGFLADKFNVGISIIITTSFLVLIYPFYYLQKEQQKR